MAEWLGRGLQNLVRRFDSVWYLKLKDVNYGVLFFVCIRFLMKLTFELKNVKNVRRNSFSHNFAIDIQYVNDVFVKTPQG